MLPVAGDRRRRNPSRPYLLPLMKLAGKVAIVTGAGRGIGRAIALDLAREGCHVVITSRTQTDLESVAAEITALGVRALPLPLDLALAASIETLVARTVADFGTIDILVNNAAVLYASPLLSAGVEEWDKTMTVNLRCVFLLSQKVLALMKERRSGYIINISSVGALGAKPDVAAYCVSKSGLVALSQSLYTVAKEFGVKVSTVYPGVTDTDMVREANQDGALGGPELWMQPEDIANCVLFLLKQSARVVVKDLVPWAVRYDRI